MELDGSRMTIYKIFLKFGMTDDCHFRFKAISRHPISVKFCTGKHNSMAWSMTTDSTFRIFEMAGGRHIANRRIALSQRKIIRFWWNLAHNNTFGTRWQPDEKNMKIFRIRDGGRPPFFGHNSAANCLIPVKFCVAKQFFAEYKGV